MHNKTGPAGRNSTKRRRGRGDDCFAQPRQISEQQRNKFKMIQERKFKRVRTPALSGQCLPVTRIIELLDNSQLRNILETVMAQHPEVVHTIQKTAVKPSVHAIIELIKNKHAQISAHLPYKCDVESDYSYIRVKPYLTEFLDCISDFILDILPPMESIFATSCHLLNIITSLIHELPKFTNNEFQYTRTIAYQQLANLWLTLLSHHQNSAENDAEASIGLLPNATEPSMEWLKTVESMKLLEELERHNDTSDGKFVAVLEYLKTELGNCSQFNTSCSPEAVAPQGSIFNDLITVDYSNYSIASHNSR